jgi:uncharacterized phage protein gp47/JayE
MGSFIVTVDDGSGSPSTALLSTIQTAVDAVRPVGSVFTVQPPDVVTVDVSIVITVAVGAAKAQVAGGVGNAIGSYINSLPIGASLPLTRLAQIAYAADATVTNVTQLSANGDANDIAPDASGVVKAGTIAVN